MDAVDRRLIIDMGFQEKTNQCVNKLHRDRSPNLTGAYFQLVFFLRRSITVSAWASS